MIKINIIVLNILYEYFQFLFQISIIDLNKFFSSFIINVEILKSAFFKKIWQYDFYLLYHFFIIMFENGGHINKFDNKRMKSTNQSEAFLLKIQCYLY